MRFSLAINLERMDPTDDMRAVADHVLEMVQLADAAGFDTAWAAEHHAIEMTIAPGPFQLLAWWAAHTERIRLGTAVAVARTGTRFVSPAKLRCSISSVAGVWSSASGEARINASSTGSCLGSTPLVPVPRCASSCRP